MRLYWHSAALHSSGPLSSFVWVIKGPYLTLMQVRQTCIFQTKQFFFRLQVFSAVKLNLLSENSSVHKSHLCFTCQKLFWSPDSAPCWALLGKKKPPTECTFLIYTDVVEHELLIFASDSAWTSFGQTVYKHFVPSQDASSLKDVPGFSFTTM